MIEQLEMWKNYFYHISNHPLHIAIFVLSLILSIAFFILFKKSGDLRKKVNFLAMHIALLFFPFVFSAVFWRCMIPMMNCMPMMFMIFVPISGIITIVLGFVLLPFMYRWSDKCCLIKNSFIKKFVEKNSKILKIKEPRVYSINDLEPAAYSITNLKPSIFVTAGLSELLTKKELEAILLHELYHHKYKTYFWKFSGNVLRLFTPVAAFTGFSGTLEKEEIEADNYAISMQNTNKCILSAKSKIKNFRTSRLRADAK